MENSRDIQKLIRKATKSALNNVSKFETGKEFFELPESQTNPFPITNEGLSLSQRIPQLQKRDLGVFEEKTIRYGVLLVNSMSKSSHSEKKILEEPQLQHSLSLRNEINYPFETKKYLKEPESSSFISKIPNKPKLNPDFNTSIPSTRNTRTSDFPHLSKPKLYKWFSPNPKFTEKIMRQDSLKIYTIEKYEKTLVAEEIENKSIEIFEETHKNKKKYLKYGKSDFYLSEILIRGSKDKHNIDYIYNFYQYILRHTGLFHTYNQYFWEMTTFGKKFRIIAAIEKENLLLLTRLMQQEGHKPEDPVDKLGGNILHMSIVLKKLNVLRWINENFHLDLNKHNNDGSAPIHLAVARGCFDIVQFLYENGADIEAPTLYYQITPYEKCLRKLKQATSPQERANLIKIKNYLMEKYYIDCRGFEERKLFWVFDLLKKEERFIGRLSIGAIRAIAEFT